MLDKRALEEAAQFQDYVAELFYKKGIPINLYSSYKYQVEKGESMAGVEIKNDKTFESTGNLFIETYERHDVNSPYVPSGINRNDNTIFYAIGNRKRVLVFCKKQLKDLIKKLDLKEIEINKKTSKGYVLPVERRERKLNWVLDENREWIIMEWKDGKYEN